MSNLNNKQARNSRSDYYNASRGGALSNDYDEDFDNRWGLRRAGSWPSDWAPRRTCELCKKQFRTDNEEGFSDFMVDVCASCLRNLVKDAKNKQKETEAETVYRRRIDEISTQ